MPTGEGRRMTWASLARSSVVLQTAQPSRRKLKPACSVSVSVRDRSPFLVDE
jgi:hypothetical protein